MLLSIPFQTLEIGNIHLTPFQTNKYGKSIASLSYKDASIDFQDVSILSPPIKVIDYNPENSRLCLDLSDQRNFQIKLNTLQDNLVSTFFAHQCSFLYKTNETYNNIRDLFHFLINETTLSIYIFPTATIKKNDNTTCKVSELVQGDIIRCVIRLHGIYKIQGKYGIRLRLQHSIPSLWAIPKI